MKKLITICLAIAIVASLSLSVFATTGGFTSSPSGKPAPELVTGKNESDECVAELIVTAYVDRNELSEEARKEIEEAYADIAGTRDLATLADAIKQVATTKGVETTDLAVSDLFDISGTECDGHGNHGSFNITLKADTLANFVCLLHYGSNGWVVVENAHVGEDGKTLVFTEDEFSPFAIVVLAPESAEEPLEEPDGNIRLVLITALITAAVVSSAYIIYLKRKLTERA